MSWGQELWDQYDNLSNHTNKGIEFLDKYGSFIKERCAIEAEYAYKLRRLVKNHQLKKKPEDEKQYSYIKAFIMMLQEIQDLAGQHEVIAEEMLSSIAKDVVSLVKDLKDERKRYLTDGQKHQTNLQLALTQLDKTKRAYDKAYKEAEKAQENFQKVDADLNLSRAEVEKAKQTSNVKTQLCEEAKTDYANQLQKANDAQRIFYCEQMPRVFVQLQEMEERRISCISKFIKNSALIHRKVFPIIDRCLDGIVKAADGVNPNDDTLLVIDRYKSGNMIPEDIPFDDLSNPRPPSEIGSGSQTLHYSNSITSKDTIRGTLSGARFKSRKGLFSLFGSNKLNFDENKDDYADLPPIQRKKRIKQKIDSIQAQINQETAVRDGLMKMKVAYEQNNALGDPTTLEGQLAENGQKMEKLQNEMKKFQNYLNEANGSLGPSPVNQRKSNRNSISEDSLSRSASDSSVGQLNTTQQNKTSGNGNNINNNNYNNGSTPKNVINHVISNHSSNTDIEHKTSNDGNDENSSTQENEFAEAELDDVDECDGDLLPALGRAKALYPFEAENEGSITMKENEEFDLVEIDQGDGWTRVRRVIDFEEGFVPTSYIEIQLYSNNQNVK